MMSEIPGAMMAGLTDRLWTFDEFFQAVGER
jgi:hypothetical protein